MADAHAMDAVPASLQQVTRNLARALSQGKLKERLRQKDRSDVEKINKNCDIADEANLAKMDKECSICMEGNEKTCILVLKDPTSSPCRHGICVGCITEIVEKEKEVRCPWACGELTHPFFQNLGQYTHSLMWAGAEASWVTPCNSIQESIHLKNKQVAEWDGQWELID